MKKDQFLSLVKNYTALTSDEATALSSLQADFPYSQIVHNLAARAAQDNDLGTREHLLHVSAIYTTDRSVLKSIMTATKGERIAQVHEPIPAEEEKVLTIVKDSPPHTDATPDENKKVANKSVSEDGKQPSKQTKLSSDTGSETISLSQDLTGDALRKEILEDLKKLKKSQHTFEAELEEFEKNHHAADSKITKKTAKKTVDTSDTLIEEIKTTKKKVAPEGKQKEQIEIIENFIKTKPSIGKHKAAPIADSDDLAEKSLLYGDNIVSETLVEILLKQGKKDKAIEVLKKLIWKFPQKKAYFAARIEDLKK